MEPVVMDDPSAGVFDFSPNAPAPLTSPPTDVGGLQQLPNVFDVDMGDPRNPAVDIQEYLQMVFGPDLSNLRFPMQAEPGEDDSDGAGPSLASLLSQSMPNVPTVGDTGDGQTTTATTTAQHPLASTAVNLPTTNNGNNINIQRTPVSTPKRRRGPKKGNKDPDMSLKSRRPSRARGRAANLTAEEQREILRRMTQKAPRTKRAAHQEAVRVARHRANMESRIKRVTRRCTLQWVDVSGYHQRKARFTRMFQYGGNASRTTGQAVVKTKSRVLVIVRRIDAALIESLYEYRLPLHLGTDLILKRKHTWPCDRSTIVWAPMWRPHTDICCNPFCGALSGDTKLFPYCAACKRARYCSERCSRVHWIVHQNHCNGLDNERAISPFASDTKVELMTQVPNPRTRPGSVLDSFTNVAGGGGDDDDDEDEDDENEEDDDDNGQSSE